ncbi:hypothetical protein [Thalassoglobus sp.]|uniref:hypothetical protein n=1 Tax=Thalassoglobus sp. TaxID=2795869 RepID=UPI003AA80A27
MAGIRTAYTDADLTFHMQVYRDFARAESCLRRLRQHFPLSRVLVVSDGDRDLRYASLGNLFDVELHFCDRLYPLRNGGRMIERVFSLWGMQTEYLFKIDPDARVHRRFRYLPDEPVAMFGDCLPIQGGCMGFTRQAGQRLLGSGLLTDPILTQPERSWALHPDGSLNEPLWNGIQRNGLIRTDWIFAYCSRELGIPQIAYSEIYSRWREPVPDDIDVAVSHPHKETTIDREEL